MLIAGRWCDGAAGARIPVVDPATGEEITRVAPRERAEIPWSCWAVLVEHSEELAEEITREHGKPLADARAEVAYAAEFFCWNAEEAVRIRGPVSTAPTGSSCVIGRSAWS